MGPCCFWPALPPIPAPGAANPNIVWSPQCALSIYEGDVWARFLAARVHVECDPLNPDLQPPDSDPVMVQQCINVADALVDAISHYEIMPWTLDELDAASRPLTDGKNLNRESQIRRALPLPREPRWTARSSVVLTKDRQILVVALPAVLHGDIQVGYLYSQIPFLALRH